VLTCANPVVPPFLDPGDPWLSKVGGLIAPFFFKDASDRSAGVGGAFRDERTFFVEPSLTEMVVQEWEGWAVPPPSGSSIDPGMFDYVEVQPQIPGVPKPIDPDPVYSIGAIAPVIDWVTHPQTTIEYHGVPVGKDGGVSPVTAGAGPAIARGVTVGGAGLSTRHLRIMLAGQRGARATAGISSGFLR
jgi:hypothetical protein